MAAPRGVDEAIARFDEIIARYDGRTPAAVGATRRNYARNIQAVGKRVANMGMAFGVLIAATIGFGLIVGPIGWTGLFLVAVLTFAIIGLFSIWPGEEREFKFSEQVPTRTLVQQLDSYLVRQRRALPAPAAQRVDAISARLPLLESKLATIDLLDPLAQDARRLMGKHLPELIDRYERIPAAYRGEKDGGGMTVDERLNASLDAAREALDDIGSKLAKEDLTAFETQGRFIENRYKDGAGFGGE
jgi:hypothetical protein